MTPGQQPVRVDEGTRCHDCACVFERIGAHWSRSDCVWPTIPDRVWAICRGLVLGDGTVKVGGTTPSLEAYSTRRPFINWLDRTLAWLSTGPFEHRSAQRSFEQASSADHDVTVGSYATIWGVRTRVHTAFDALAAWYATSEQRRQLAPPRELELGPWTCAVWYAGDGSLHYDARYPDSAPYVTIGVDAILEHRSPRTVTQWFDGTPVTPTVDVSDGVIRFDVASTRTLLEWLPVCPGYEYKWELESYEAYQSARP